MDKPRLQQLREEINALDSKLVQLLNDRAKIAIAMGEAKQGKPAYDPHRENEVLSHIDEINQGPLPKGSIEEIYASIITACREIQIKE